VHLEGRKLRLPRGQQTLTVRFRHKGKRVERSTGKSDPAQAAREAAQLYAPVRSAAHWAFDGATASRQGAGRSRRLRTIPKKRHWSLDPGNEPTVDARTNLHAEYEQVTVQFDLQCVGFAPRCLHQNVERENSREKEKIREKRSRHIVDAFFSWCDAEAGTVLDDTPISNGIRYARNQRVGLSRFLDDGRLPIHNNLSELALRREAVGRKNWLFVGSDDAGAVNALFTSLLASCRLCDVEPWTYLRDIFCLLPRWPDHRLLDLAPIAWNKTRQRDDLQSLLDRNQFRKLTLDVRG
jgi:Transposase IS66 family/IS66 C-terminal element